MRDLLAGIEPKDFDIATSAHPEEVRKLFRSCRLVGRRFVICHVRFGREVIEVTTFRGPITDSHERDETGRILVDNDYGTLEEDAFRRDFTINALYYDIRDFAVVDFCNGVEDLKSGTLRLIGDPELRYREDPVRMLRAIRIANKMKFRLAPEAAEPMKRLAPLLADIPAARLFDEILKVLLNVDGVDNLFGLRVYGLFAQLFPETDARLDDAASLAFVQSALRNSGERIRTEQRVSPAFLFAALLWPPVEARFKALQAQEGHSPHDAMNQAAEEVIQRAIARVAIPKRFSMPMREIWTLQLRWEQRSSARARRTLSHPKFRAAYDFLLLRSESQDADLIELAQWWTQAQESGEFPVAQPGEESDEAAPRRRPRRRRRGRRRASPG